MLVADTTRPVASAPRAPFLRPYAARPPFGRTTRPVLPARRAFAGDDLPRSWPLSVAGSALHAASTRLRPVARIEDVVGVRVDELRMAVDAVDAIARQVIATLPPPQEALAELGRIVSLVGAGHDDARTQTSIPARNRPAPGGIELPPTG